MQLRCPECCSEEARPTARNGFNCGNCGAGFAYEEALVSVADAEAHAAARAECTCDDVRGCPRCFARAEDMIGALIRDGHDREWVVETVGEKDGFPTIGGSTHWDRPEEVEVLRRPDDPPLHREVPSVSTG